LVSLGPYLGTYDALIVSAAQLRLSLCCRPLIIKADPPSFLSYAPEQPRHFHRVEQQRVGAIEGGAANGVPMEVGWEHGAESYRSGSQILRRWA